MPDAPDPTTTAAPPPPTPPPTPARERAPTRSEETAPPDPPEAAVTTLEALPAGFWDEEPAPAPPPRPRADAPKGSAAASPPALASLQGMALLQAVFPGRVVKVEPTATAEGDLAPDDVPVPAHLDATDDEPDGGADAPRPPTP